MPGFGSLANIAIVLLPALGYLKEFVDDKPTLSLLVLEMIYFVRTLHEGINSSSKPDMNSLHDLKRMLFWIPVKLRSEPNGEPARPLILSYLHALGASYAPPQGKIPGRYCGLIAAPIEAFHEELLAGTKTGSKKSQARYKVALDLMGIPLSILKKVEPLSARKCLSEKTGETHGAPGIDKGKIVQILLDFPIGFWQNFV